MLNHMTSRSQRRCGFKMEKSQQQAERMTFFPLCNNNVRAVITFGPGNRLEVFLRREVLPAPCLFQALHSHVLAGNLSGNHIPFPVPVQQCNPSQPLRLTDCLIVRAWERNVTTRGQKCWHFQSRPMLPFRRNFSSFALPTL